MTNAVRMTISEPAEENYKSGFIRVYRNISTKCWYTKSEYVHLWFHLIIRAARKDRRVMVNGTMITLKAGQILTSRDGLEKETGIDASKIQRLLKFFTEIEQQIEQQTYSKYRVITILNWDLYQSSEKSEQQNEQQLNSKRTASEQQLNTYNKLDNIDKVDKEDKKVNIAFSLFWDLYDKKRGEKGKIEKKWDILSDEDRQAIMVYIPKYIASEPSKKFRKDPDTFLNNKSWLDEIITETPDAPKQQTASAGTPVRKIDHSLRD